MNYLGVDPGASGGMALLDCHGDVIVAVQPANEFEVASELRHLTESPCSIAVEKVGGYVGGEGQPGSAMFNFGRGAGVIVGCLLALGKEFEEVTPQRWQASLGLKRARGLSKAAWKRQLRAKARELWPRYRVTLWAADALLIARWAVLQSSGAVAATPPADAFNDAWFG